MATGSPFYFALYNWKKEGDKTQWTNNNLSNWIMYTHTHAFWLSLSVISLSCACAQVDSLPDRLRVASAQLVPDWISSRATFVFVSLLSDPRRVDRVFRLVYLFILFFLSVRLYSWPCGRDRESLLLLRRDDTVLPALEKENNRHFDATGRDVTAATGR